VSLDVFRERPGVNHLAVPFFRYHSDQPEISTEEIAQSLPQGAIRVGIETSSGSNRLPGEVLWHTYVRGQKGAMLRAMNIFLLRTLPDRRGEANPKTLQPQPGSGSI
jgi:hypothetical protein